MNTTKAKIRQDNYIGTLFKWTCLSLFFMLCAMLINTLHQDQLQKLTVNSDLFKQKSFLISEMYNEMLSISRMQLEILHSSSEQQIRENLWQLSELVSDHLVHYHQLKSITDESDTELLMSYQISFDKWHGFNNDLLDYANIVSDSGFINILNKVDLAFSQLDSDVDEKLLLVTQLK